MQLFLDKESIGAATLGIGGADATALSKALADALGDLAFAERRSGFEPVSARRFRVSVGPLTIALSASEARSVIDCLKELPAANDPQFHCHVDGDDYAESLVIHRDEDVTTRFSVTEVLTTRGRLS
jgi:hypothetical protein